MARVKKYQLPTSGIDKEKRFTEETLNKPSITGSPTEVEGTAVPPAKRRMVKVEGYDEELDLDDPEVQRYLTNRMRSYSGDANTAREFQYVDDIYRKEGGLTEVLSTGVGKGLVDPSTHNQKAGRRERIWGYNKDASRQRAAITYNKMLQDYMQQKSNPTPIQEDYSFDLTSAVRKASNDESGEYFDKLNHGERIGFIQNAVYDYVDRVQGKGAWDDKTHKGNRELYELFSKEGADEEFKNDFERFKQEALADGVISPGETAWFVQKWKVNPHSLLGDRVKSTTEIQAEADAKQKEEEQKALDEKNRIRERDKLISSYDFTGSGFSLTNPDDDLAKNWTNEEWETYLKDPKNYTLTDRRTDYYQADIWAPRNKMFNGRWVNGKYLPEGLVDGAYDRWSKDRRNTLLGGLTVDEAAVRNQTVKKQHPELLLMAGDSYIYDVTGKLFSGSKGQNPTVVTFQNKNNDGRSYGIMLSSGKFLQFDHNDITEDPNRKGYYYVDVINPENGQKLKIQLGTVGRNLDPSKLEIYNGYKQGPSVLGIDEKAYNALSTNEKTRYIRKTVDGKTVYVPLLLKKQGGTINMNKVKKFQWGGFVTTNDLSQEQLEQRAKNKQYEKGRSAYMNGEVFSSDNQDIELRDSDKMKLAALGLDAAGLVGALIPGGGAFSTGTGMLGTGLNTLAEIKDRENTGKSGWDIAKETGLGLALDAASILPGLGGAAKTSKLIKGIKTSWKLIRSGLMANGLAESLPSFNKLMSDEKLTIDDWRQIASGLTTIVNVGKSGAKRLASKKVTNPTDIDLQKGNKLQFDDINQRNAFSTKLKAYLDAVKSKTDIKSKLDRSDITPETRTQLETQLRDVNQNINRLNSEIISISKKGKVVDKTGKELRSYDFSKVASTAKGQKGGYERQSLLGEKEEGVRWYKRLQSPVSRKNEVSERQWYSKRELDNMLGPMGVIRRGAAKWVNGRNWGNMNSGPLVSRAIANDRLNQINRNLPFSPVSRFVRIGGLYRYVNPRNQAAANNANATNASNNASNAQSATPNTLTGGGGPRGVFTYIPSSPTQGNGRYIYGAAQPGVMNHLQRMAAYAAKIKELRDDATANDIATQRIARERYRQTILNNQIKATKFREKRKAEELARKEENLARRLLSKNAKGGVIRRFQSGGTGLQSDPGLLSEESYLEKARKGFMKLASPEAMKYLNSIATNKRVMDIVNKMPASPKMTSPQLTLHQAPGMAQAAQAYENVALMGQGQPMYSDAKLNSVNNLALNQQKAESINSINQNLLDQSLNVRAANTDILNQQSQLNAQTAYQNAGAAYQDKMNKANYLMGNEKTKGQSLDNLFSVAAQKKDIAEERMNKISDTLEQLRIIDLYKPTLDAIETNPLYKDRATDPSQMTAYNDAIEAVRKKLKKDMLTYQKKQYGNVSWFKSGGSLEEKKELIAYKEELKRVLAGDKAFNKYIADKVKSHEKMISLLLKNKK